MRQMDRRTFLLSTGRWLVLAGVAPAVSGCGRALRWSDSQGSIADDSLTVASDAEPGTTTSASIEAGSSTTTSAGPTPTEGTSGSGSTTTTGAPAPPDLAVIRGDFPDKNVRAAIARLGGMERFVKNGAKVVVKPNVLTGRPPEYATTTNPIVLSTIIRMCLEVGADKVTVLDYPTSSARAAFKESGLAQATAEAGGTLKYLSNRDFDRVDIPEGTAIDSWPLVTEALEADTLINVPIGKTHGMAGLTLAMKNLMGIMGDSRGKIHIDYPQKITDVNTLVKPHLVILDAYRILTRNGPTGGNLDDVAMPKTVVAGTSQVAVDAYGATIMGWQPTDLASLVEAAARGLGEIDLSKYTIFEGTA
jgi:uncharacterized protein (DUF362 family)